MIFNIFFQLFRSSQDSTVPVSLPGPSVAPYPPLRLVPPTTNTLPTQPAPQQSVFRYVLNIICTLPTSESFFKHNLFNYYIYILQSSVETGLGQPTWMRVPPSMLGRRIVTTINGKKQVIVFTREDQRNGI